MEDLIVPVLAGPAVFAAMLALAAIKDSAWKWREWVVIPGALALMAAVVFVCPS